MDTQEIEKIDAKLREVFRRNAPPSDERRLAVALQPDALGKSAYHPGRTSQRQRPRWTVRTAVIVAAVLVLAVGVGMGVWKIVGMMGQGDSIIMITDTPMVPLPSRHPGEKAREARVWWRRSPTEPGSCR